MFMVCPLQMLAGGHHHHHFWSHGAPWGLPQPPFQPTSQGFATMRVYGCVCVCVCDRFNALGPKDHRGCFTSQVPQGWFASHGCDSGSNNTPMQTKL